MHAPGSPDAWVAGFCVAGFSIRQQKTRIIKPEIASGEPSSPSLVARGGIARRATPPPPLFICCAYTCRRARDPPNAKMRAPRHPFALSTFPVTDKAIIFELKSLHVQWRRRRALFSLRKACMRGASGRHSWRSRRVAGPLVSKFIGLAPLGF